MKLHAIEFARQRGMRWLRAFHHPGNTRAIAMNRRLGFTGEAPLPGGS
jgi:L-amino acid N-acyltransferase YncA